MNPDFIESEIFKKTISKAKRKAPRDTCKISIIKKDVELFIAPRIFHDLSVKPSLHIDIKFDERTIAYSLGNPKRSKTYNFNKFIYSLDVKAFLQDNSVLPCTCEDSDFKVKNNQHRKTGDF